MTRHISPFARLAAFFVATGPIALACSSSDKTLAQGGAGGSSDGGGTAASGAAGSSGSSGSPGSSGGNAGSGAKGSSGGSSAGAGGSLSGSGGANSAGGTGGATAAGGAAGGVNDAGPNPASLIDELILRTKACATVASTHTYALDNGTKVDICALNGAVYWTADMDIDCDGVMTTACNATTDCCYQNDTAFHNNADQPLTASTTPYVVIPGDFSYPGLHGGNVTAVIFQGKLQWAVFGDTGPANIIGEASYACAQKLGINPDPKNGGTGSGVTYITFVGNGTAPSDIENQSETKTLGEQLAQRLIQNN